MNDTKEGRRYALRPSFRWFLEACTFLGSQHHQAGALLRKRQGHPTFRVMPY
jgi:hypothetical protein